MKRYLLTFVALLGIYTLSWTPALATTYYGPSFSTPTAITPGSPINIVMSTASGSITPFPTDNTPPCSGTCSFPQQDWVTPNACFVSLNEVTVTDPDGNQFMLGSSITSGLFFPNAFNGNSSTTKVPPHAPALNFTVGDTFTLPFGTGPEGFTFTSVLNSTYNANPEGPYYWWVSVVAPGNPDGYTAGTRLDTTNINPTMIRGTYTVDIQGVVACPGTTTPFKNVLFFDIPTIVTTPEFGAGMAVATAAALLGLLVLRRKMPILSASTPS